MKKDNKNMKEAGVFRFLLVLVLVIGMMASYPMSHYYFNSMKTGEYLSPNLTDEIEGDLSKEGASWKKLAVWTPDTGWLGEATPTGSGILEVYYYPHAADPATTYNENTSATLEAASLNYTDVNATERDVTHSTAFDIVVRVRGNATHCKRGATWWDSDLRVTISSDANLDPQLSSEVAVNVVTGNNTDWDYLYVNTYVNNTPSGFTIGKGVTSEITSILYEAYY